MTRHPGLLTGLLLAGVLGAGPAHAQAQTLKQYTSARQFHGEVRLDARIEFGGGSLQVQAGDPGSLYSMRLAYDAERFQPVSNWNADEGAVTLGLASRGSGSIGVRGTSQKQTADIRFSPQADLDLTLVLGAALSTVDLGGLRLSSLNLETGASQTEVRFSRKNAMRCTTATFRAGAAALTVTGLGNSRCDTVTFEGGMGSVVLDYTGDWQGDASLEATMAVGGLILRIPRAVGVRISTDQFLTTFQPAGFTREGSRYISSSDAAAAHHLDVTLSTSLGGVTVEWVD